MKKPIDDQKLLELFRKGAKESPSKELDQKILNYAESQTKKVDRHKWWPYLGLAASVCFIAILSPWQWQEANIDPLSNSVELEQHGETSPAPQVQMKKSRVASPQADQFMSLPELQSEQRVITATESVIPQAVIPNRIEQEEKQWGEVYQLLEAGETEKAQTLLEKILSEQPKLKDELPQRLKQLQQKSK